VGDSLTYGSGVGVEEAYPAVLEGLLGRDYRVEVLNLGIGGYQSENILWVIHTFAPALDPDLVIYGVCLNDFLPSRVGEYRYMTYPFPLPRAVKDFLARRTIAGELIANGYNQLLVRLNLRKDFYSDILDGINGCQEKFDRDVRAMNHLAAGMGLPPIVAMVLNQHPRTSGPDWRLAKLAETYLRAAGMTVVPADQYYRQYNGADLRVSRWEGHPNAQAHRIFAEQFAAAIRPLPMLQAYRK
jgi:lysophospholipase L1-like esterase